MINTAQRTAAVPMRPHRPDANATLRATAWRLLAGVLAIPGVVDRHDGFRRAITRTGDARCLEFLCAQLRRQTAYAALAQAPAQRSAMPPADFDAMIDALTYGRLCSTGDERVIALRAVYGQPAPHAHDPLACGMCRGMGCEDCRQTGVCQWPWCPRCGHQFNRGADGSPSVCGECVSQQGEPIA